MFSSILIRDKASETTTLQKLKCSKYVIHFMKLTFNGYNARRLDVFSIGFREYNISCL